MLDFDETVRADEASALLQARGLVGCDGRVASLIGGLLDTIVLEDRRLGGRDGPAFRAELAGWIGAGVLVLGTPLLQFAARRQASAAACTVLFIPNGASFEPDGELFNRSRMLLTDGAGVGYDLSNLDDPCEALSRLNEHLTVVHAAMKHALRRPPAAMATLRCDHPDIQAFIRAKRDVDFHAWRLNISVFVSDEFLTAARTGQLWPLHDYAGQVVDHVDAEAVLRQIADCACYCGEPGVLFKDRIDEDNPIPDAPFISTAPCAELAMAEGDGCHFSYINVGALVRDGQVDFERLGLVAAGITRMLDATIEITVRGVGHVLDRVGRSRRIGVGVTGFADLLARLKIPYAAPEAVALASTLAEHLDFHTKAASVALARERGAFPDFERSRYGDIDWVRRKLVNRPLSMGEESWRALADDIVRHGIRHATTTAMPPTGASSAILGISKSLEPHFSYRTDDGRPHGVFRSVLAEANLQAAPVAEQDAALARLPYARLATEIPPSAHIDIQSAFQAFLDDSVSKTINLRHGARVDDVLDILLLADDRRLKGVSVFRDGCLEQRALLHAS